MKQFVLTSAAGKRLIGKAVAGLPEVIRVLNLGTVVIVAGTTNGYVAEEILGSLGESGFDRRSFLRGVTLPPQYDVSESGRVPGGSNFPGDVIIRDGKWQCGRTIGEVADELEEGDIIIKGANALDPVRGRAAVLIGHEQGGTTTIALRAVMGRRVRLILPVGLEKRVYGDLDEMASKLILPGAKGLRLLPVPGEVFTEIEALSFLAGVRAELIAAGGVCGAEGSIRLAVSGDTEADEVAAERIIQSVVNEPPFAI